MAHHSPHQPSAAWTPSTIIVSHRVGFATWTAMKCVKIQHTDLYMSRAMPKSPILATRSGPGQESRQFLAAMSLKNTGSVTKCSFIMAFNSITHHIHLLYDKLSY